MPPHPLSVPCIISFIFLRILNISEVGVGANSFFFKIKSITIRFSKCFYFPLQASGDGLVKGFTNTPAKFTINAVKANLHTNGQLTITVGGKSVTVEPTITDENNGKYNVTYTPRTAEDYRIAICYEEKHIPGSPFRATILEQADASKCIAEGDCLSPTGDLVDGDPLDMTVTTKDAGHGKLHVTATGPGNKPTNTFLAEREDGKVGVRVESQSPGRYVVNVLWNDKHIPKSPFTFDLIKRLTAADMQVSLNVDKCMHPHT